ncbi:MAG: glucoamylase family protein [Spirochaetota bacterium]
MGLRGNSLSKKYAGGEPPLRSELFSASQMEQHGKILAGSHALSPGHNPEYLLSRLAENEGVLLEVRDLLTEAIKSNRRIAPAGEWLLDNFYLIEEQIRIARRHLPKGYSKGLPRLKNGPSAGLPRVYDIALEIISHGDGRVDIENLSSFVAAYQKVSALHLGELWAIPIMLRLALIENLRRVSARIAADRINRNLADYWADRITETAENDPKSLILMVADMARSNPPIVSSFVAELTRRLQGLGPALALPLTWIEQQLSESFLTIEQLVQSENQQQAADQQSISNSIGGLRFLGAMDWREFVESMSVVEAMLMEDPCGVYSRMDFPTRDRYRHVVEKIAKHSTLSEIGVAREAIRLAKNSAAEENRSDCRAAHVGFYLIDKGLEQLERRTGTRFSVLETIQKAGRRFPLLLYLGFIILITVISTAGLLAKAYYNGLHGFPLWILAILLLLSVSQLAITLANWFATRLVTPRPLPRMDFTKGIPQDEQTLVVVPAMLSSIGNIEQMVNALEVRFLANRDENLYFSLLTDFRDASEKSLPDDEQLSSLVRQRIEELNEKYTGSKSGVFCLFHRPRQWNSKEQVWMGYERKRGKLAALNSFLRGGAKSDFSIIVGNIKELSKIKYVITLDADTQLSRDSARQLAGAMSHVLNRPQYDERKQRISAGYGILQPRVSMNLPGSNRSGYGRMFGSDSGIDPYTRVVSDVYQDLFGEGSFIGKGIYDIDAFEQVLKGRFPENRILSHDLIEGCYARSGLISDVQLYEEYPSRYSADVSRRRRWIRGDWQILRWLLPGVPGEDGRFQKNSLSLLSRWKIFDNLRRSLTATALTLLLLSGWLILPLPWLWTLSVIGIIFIPQLISSLTEFFQKPDEVLLSQHFDGAMRTFGRHFAQIIFAILCLPYEAFFSTNAILHTAWRMLITRKHLLEWNPSGESEASGRTDFAGSLRAMWIAPLIAAATAYYLAFSRPYVLFIALPVLILWFLSPVFTWWISRPFARQEAKLSAGQIVFLRRISRKTWAFFETFVGEQDNWLPPDNLQEDPVAVIAHRTSPTNMGLALLANLSAWDFGYINSRQLIERTGKAFHTMENLERFRGHFYNWYDTESLKPLLPMYVSTVDSGNLAAHLLTLQQGLIKLPDTKIIGPQLFDGLRDTLNVFMDAVGENRPAGLVQLQKYLESVCVSQPDTLEAAREIFDKLMTFDLDNIQGFDPASGSQAGWWARAFAEQCRAVLDDLTLFVPWTGQPLFPNNLSSYTGFGGIPTLRQIADLDAESMPFIKDQSPNKKTTGESERVNELTDLIRTASKHAAERITVIEKLVIQCRELARMEYAFLFDESRHLLAIGYNVSGNRRDGSYYDLLASEARISSFVAIAQGQLPQENWFALGRLLTTAGGEPVLLSWSGSMFEYLMPLLVMPTYENSLLYQTCKAAVARQIEYGKKIGVPWGISESGYNMIDIHFNYQYRAFGVPGLGLKRGLTSDTVIAPYASALALMVAPSEACINLEELSALGAEGKYGFYEAVDYTPGRIPRGQSSAIVRSFMAHHQGMSFLSLAYLILDRQMQKRFESDLSFQATMPLLQERVPKAMAFYSNKTEFSKAELHSALTDVDEMPIRVYDSPDTPMPEVQLLSNGRYHVMITNAGGGFSRWKDMAVTRWREDGTCDNWGTFCYIRDLASEEFWSTSYQPALKASKNYEAIFSEGRAEFRRRDYDFDTYTEIAVSPEDDIELRRITITNRGRTRKTIDITSYAEVVLANQASDAMHPAFSNLFVETEIVRRKQAIFCTRRPRSTEEHPPIMFHLMVVHGAETGEVSYETDRMRFIGRGNTLIHPEAMSNLSPLSGTEGPVLDPVVAIRNQIILNPEKQVTINIVTGVGETRDITLSLVEKYRDRNLADRVFNLAWTHSQVLLRQINAVEADAQLYGHLAASVIYANSSLRAAPGILIRNKRQQSGLWGYSISGDIPIVLLQIEDQANINLVRQLIQAYTYWRLKGLAVDLVIWNEDHAGYRQNLQDQITALIAAGNNANAADRPGSIYVRLADQISEEDRILFQSVARVVIIDSRGTLSEQMSRRNITEETVPDFIPVRTKSHDLSDVAALPRQDLIFYNGLGGFTPDGREYVISTSRGQLTPAPWANVLANPDFGTVISESGTGYTWSENAHEFRLTPWYNDPVSDSGGEAFYIRDEDRGHYWSPMPLPCRGHTPYITRHGFGYSVFEHTERGINTEVWVYVAIDAPVKFTVIKVRNKSDRIRRLSVTGFAEWVLGDLRAKSAMHIVTEIEPQSGALLARNPYSTEFSSRIAFFNADDTTRTVSGDRREFLGRNGTMSNPAAMTRSRLSGKTGASFDPCGTIRVSFELAARGEREIVFTMGAVRNAADAGNLIHRFWGSVAARGALEAVWQYWKHTLGAVNVETPDRSVNILANGWLLYQTIACRLWARSGYYQSGGAFGFRDQLQDVMAVIHSEPRLVRGHLLLCAAHQFKEGDVQHWWHPPSGRGVRTHCSDDYLWLPLAVARYVLTTGDTGVLDETIHFIEGRPVNADEDSYYDLPGMSGETAGLYDHCVRAIMRSLESFGAHGLPLIGSGDWNDGMNKVGENGKGESVWLGFFLYKVFIRFNEIARLHNDLPFAERCLKEAGELKKNIEQNAWDGEWYLRAFFDDGSPLGSAHNAECRIDSIAQSWSVLSGAGDARRSRKAMDAVEKHLVRRDRSLVQLLDPPFDKSNLNPGYIKGYVPGVRENGGQYTHGAVWTAMAFAALGDRDRAWEILSIINPVSHGLSPETIETYKAEPYVVAADVYAVSPHIGRGGWTWYTGSAGWMYRLIMESLLGLRLEVDKLRFEPCLPADWETFQMHYRYRETIYHIIIRQMPAGSIETILTIDGVERFDNIIPLVDDRQEHAVELIIVGAAGGE